MLEFEFSSDAFLSDLFCSGVFFLAQIFII